MGTPVRPPLLRAFASAALLAVVVALLAPRGPVTTEGALALLPASVLVGTLTGRIAGSRWTIVAAPVAYAVIFEILSDHAGMTAGAADLSSAWGVAAAIVGRLLHGLVALLPLGFGAALGAAWARHTTAPPPTGRTRPWRWLRGLATMVVGLVLVVVAWQLARPASVPPVAGPRPIAELVRVERGGAAQWLSIRGADRRNPVVLYLPGGPGQSDLGIGRVALAPLTTEFTVAILDPRGTGKSYPSFDADAMLTDALVADVIAAADELRRRLGQRRIILLGESAGSVVGVLAVQRAPDRFSAWFGSGQMVDPLATDRRIRDDLERALRQEGERDDLARLEAMGTPPYPRASDYAWVAARYDHIAGDYDPPAAYTARLDAGAVGPLGLLAPEYSLVDRFGALRGLMDTFSVVYPTWQGLDFRASVRELRVPVHLFMGEHELAGRRVPAQEWFRQVSAPWKQWHAVPSAGHAAAFERIDLLRAALRAEAGRTTPTGPPGR